MARSHRSSFSQRSESDGFWSLVADILRGLGNLLCLPALALLLTGTLLLPIGSASAAGGGDGSGELPYGVYTCDQGYVWREAVAYDYVCVSPWTREWTASDNAQAPYRIDPNGAYGPSSCIQGYVWREVTPNDLVCVEPWVRDNVAFDNAHAEERWVSDAASFDELFAQMSGGASGGTAGSTAGGEATVDYGASANDGRQTTGEAHQTGPQIWTSTYYYDPVAGCHYDEDAGEEICRSSSSGLIPRIQVNGDGFSPFGVVSVGVYEPGTDVLVAQYDTVMLHGTRFEMGIEYFDCTGKTNGVKQYEVLAYDWITETWSNALTVTVCTAVH
jgi:hypothetical protein